MIGIGIGVGRGIVNQLPFRFTVNTNNTSAGSSTSTQFRMPLSTSTGLNMRVDWGDGNVEIITNHTLAIHTYASAGTYTISVTGSILGWQFANSGDRLKMLNVSQWSGLNISVDRGFYGCTNLTASATDAPLITTTNFLRYFESCTNFNGQIGNWDVSSITIMASMFESASSFNQNIGAWDVSNVVGTTTVEGFHRMFLGASVFNNGNSPDIDNWRFTTTGTVTFQQMFQSANAFNQSINNWNTERVSNMQEMFQNNISFNGNIGNWNTSLCNTMFRMFNGASAFNQNIGAWNVSNVTTFSSMFSGATAFNNGGSADINNWTIRTASAVSMGSMFRSCTFNQNISSWNTSAVTNMSAMFSLNGAFNQPIGSWNTSAVTDMNNMFSSSNFNQNIGAWNVSNVTSFTNMFGANYSFNNGGSSDINNWTIKNTGTVSMTGMFGDSTFNQPIGNWNTSAVTNMSLMFRFNTTFNQNIGSWNVSNVTNFSSFMDGKSAANYSAANLDSIYNGWSSRPVQPNLSITFGSIKYTAAGQAGKDILDFAPNNWTLVDGGI
jgi:surface protein